MWWLIYQYTVPCLIFLCVVYFVVKFLSFALKMNDKEYMNSTKVKWDVLRVGILVVGLFMLIGALPPNMPTTKIETSPMRPTEREVDLPTQNRRETLEEKSKRLLNQAEENRQKSINHFESLPAAKER